MKLLLGEKPQHKHTEVWLMVPAMAAVHLPPPESWRSNVTRPWLLSSVTPALSSHAWTHTHTRLDLVQSWHTGLPPGVCGCVSGPALVTCPGSFPVPDWLLMWFYTLGDSLFSFIHLKHIQRSHFNMCNLLEMPWGYFYLCTLPHFPHWNHSLDGTLVCVISWEKGV